MVEVGQVYGRLRIECKAEFYESGFRAYQADAPYYDAEKQYWFCSCQCGNSVFRSEENLSYRTSHSCGCYSKEPLYGVWTGMKSRCLNPNNPSYREYGGKGVTICREWLEDFDCFREAVPKRPNDRHILVLIDKQLGFQPGNVRWTTRRKNLIAIRAASRRQQ